MCRNIKRLYNFDPPVTDEEIAAASLQFVRKLSGFHHPSKANEMAFNQAIEAISQDVRILMSSLATDAKSLNREEEAKRAHERSLKRFGSNKS